jgi:hypothetical protein
MLRKLATVATLLAATFLAACATSQHQPSTATRSSATVEAPKSFAEAKELVVKSCDTYETECYIRFISLSDGKVTDIKRQSGRSWGTIQSSVYQGGVLTVKVAQERKGIHRVVTLSVDEQTGTGMLSGPLSGGRPGNFTEKLQVMKRS